MLDDFFNFILPISIQLFSAFGLYTLLFLIIRIFNRKQYLLEIDKKSCDFISFIGLIYFSCFFIWIILELSFKKDNDLSDRIFGRYWFGFWMQPTFWIILSQLLRIQKIANNILFRIVSSILFILSFEKIVIITTSLHRDYLPSSWTMHQEAYFLPSNFWLALILKIVEFLILVYIFSFIKIFIRRKNFKNS
jgi:molybdopterin-containing oxidoreductase family membrane subunit